MAWAWNNFLNDKEARRMASLVTFVCYQDLWDVATRENMTQDCGWQFHNIELILNLGQNPFPLDSFLAKLMEELYQIRSWNGLENQFLKTSKVLQGIGLENSASKSLLVNRSEHRAIFYLPKQFKNGKEKIFKHKFHKYILDSFGQ